MPKNLALFGGSFNPPGKHHRVIAEALSTAFDEVIVVPCGPRPDKPVTNDVEPVHRAAMVDLTFRGVPRVGVELFDLEARTFTRTHELEQRFARRGNVWHVVGADLLKGGAAGQSAVQRTWEQGPRLWQESRFAVIERAGYPLEPADLPPNHRVFQVPMSGASQEIRSRVFHRQPFEELIVPRVNSYIERHGLYRGGPARRIAGFSFLQPRFQLAVDESNAKAQAVAEQFAPYLSDDPELLVVIGGDGTMLRAIREHWRKRVPFYGVNAGHLGFLLNEDSPLVHIGKELVLAHVPLLYVETNGPQGKQSGLAFNDAWVERGTGQAAWIRVKVNGQERLPRLVADGALVSTAAGSTSYARAMGASPLPLGTPALLLVGSNVLKPDFWRPVVLPLDSTVEFATCDKEKRPLHGYVDGVSHGTVYELTVRASRIAAAEMVYSPQLDPAAKLAQIQFPQP
jgi:nicotinate (nicotinamide) nucleotide adenylyltransferase